MAQWVNKAPDDLSLSTENVLWKESQLQKVVLGPPNMHCGTHTSVNNTHTICKVSRSYT